MFWIIQSPIPALWNLPRARHMYTQTAKYVQQTIEYIPGLYKLFDEGAVNARDHYVRQADKLAAGDCERHSCNSH